MKLSTDSMRDGEPGVSRIQMSLVVDVPSPVEQTDANSQVSYMNWVLLQS